jgi:hypothetical protein
MSGGAREGQKQERKGREGKEQGRKGFHVEKRVGAARVAIIRL